MKRDKITFVFFLIPIFLFSGSLKHFSFNKEKNPNPSLTQKQIRTIEEGQPFHSKRIQHGQDQVPVKSRPNLLEKLRAATRPNYQTRKTKRIPLASSRDFLSERAEKPKRSPFRQKIKYLNEGRPFHPKRRRYVPGEVLVKFKPTISDQMIDVIIEAYQSRKLKRIKRIGIYKIQIPEDVTVEEMLFMLRQNPDVEYAEPNYIAYVAKTPNDPLFLEYQYALYNTGQELGPPGSPQGKERADIKATAAWEETTGDENVIIAVIDTGVDLEHPDIDDEDKIHSSGYDFVNDDSDPTDDFGHGTHIAGIAAAETDNDEGIAGVAWKCKILPIKVLDDQGEGSYDQMIQGIYWAADLDEDNDGEADVDVINFSIGGDSPSQFLNEALEYAYNKNIVIVAAAGNALLGEDPAGVLYPAAYDDYCLAVAATNYNDERVTFENSSEDPLYKWESKYGPEIDVAAPGITIVSIVPTWYFGPGSFPYGFGDGTSTATPHVAGMAALIKSIKPWLTNVQIMNIIRYTADDVNSSDFPGVDDFIGYGRINMEKALVPIEIKPSK